MKNSIQSALKKRFSRFNINRSLKLRFIFFVTLLTFITMSLVVIFSINRERAIIIESVVQKSTMAARTIARAASDMNEEQIAQIGDLCTIIIQDSDINSIIISKISGFFEERSVKTLASFPEGADNRSSREKNDADGGITLREDISQIKYYFNLGNSFDLFVPFKFKNSAGGRVWLEVSLKTTQKALNWMLWQNLVITALLTFFGGLISVFLAQFVLKPLNYLISSTQKISEGIYDAKMPVTGSYEASYLSTVFNEMVERLEQKEEFENRMRNLDKLATIGQLSAGIAHEIKNPLTSIRSLIELLKEEEGLSAEGMKSINIAISEVDRLNKVTNEFVSLAKPYKNRNLTFFDVNEVLKKISLLLKPQLKKNGIELYCNLNSKFNIFGEADELAQVFLNIIINSMQSFQVGKTSKAIIINSRDAGDCCKVEIIDNGCGIDKEGIPKIFMPFFTNKPSGTGLGLSIVKRILDDMKAEVEIESLPASGTAFKISFPIKSDYSRGGNNF